MALITFEDKVALNENPNIPDVNKIKNDDANELKYGVNDLLKALGLDTDTWSSSETYTAGDMVVYHGQIYENLTGANSTAPNQDTTNWELIPILVNE